MAQKINATISKWKQQDTLAKRSPTTTDLQIKESHCELSVYSGKLTKIGYVNATKRVMAAFPKLDKNFYDLLYDMIIESGFSDKRLWDSVNHVIKTCEYPEPTPAKFLNFDKKIKLYTYDQKLKLMNDVGANLANRMYGAVRLPGKSKPMWAHVNDIEDYGLDLWHVAQHTENKQPNE